MYIYCLGHVMRSYYTTAQLLTASISSSVRSGSSEEQSPTSGMSGRRRRQRQTRSKEVDVQSLLKRMRKSDSQSTDSPASLK